MISRRRFLMGLGGAGLQLTLGATARAHNDAGVVSPPVAPPNLDLTLTDGQTSRLAKVLRGKVTALQLMFTSCGMTCPIQGAVFASAAKELGDSIPNAQWLSVSIDPGRDDPRALSAWMTRFGGHARWRAARPDAKDLERFLGFLRSTTKGPDKHTAQVYFFDREGRLVMRSVDFPPAKELTRVLVDLAQQR